MKALMPQLHFLWRKSDLLIWSITKNNGDKMKNNYKLLMILGVFLVVSFIMMSVLAVMFVRIYNAPSTGMVGGADGPTAKFIITALWSDYKALVFIIAGELIAGIGCITASIIMKKKR